MNKTIITVLSFFLSSIVLGQSFDLKEVEGVYKGKLEMYSLVTKQASQPEVTLTIVPIVKCNESS